MFALQHAALDVQKHVMIRVLDHPRVLLVGIVRLVVVDAPYNVAVADVDLAVQMVV